MLWAAECQSHLQGDSKAALVGDAGGGDTPEAVVVLIWLWSRDEGFRAEGFWQLPERVARESANFSYVACQRPARVRNLELKNIDSNPRMWGCG